MLSMNDLAAWALYHDVKISDIKRMGYYKLDLTVTDAYGYQ